MLDEPDAGLIRRELAQYGEHVSSAILRIELRRVALRQNCLPEADQLLSRIALVPLDNQLLSAAETLQPPEVGTLDAIHLVTALRLATRGQVSAILTFDRQLIRAATIHGLKVTSPS